MRNEASWKASKFVMRGTSLRASRDPKRVAVGSRLMADCVAEAYWASLPVFARGRLLDLGCGEVPLYGVYRKLVAEIVCVDWWRSLHAGGRLHLDLEADLGCPLPFAGSTFDTVLCSDVLEHVPSPASLCREVSRLLRPSGALIMNVPFYYWIHERPHDYYRYTEYALRRLATESGLGVVHLSALGGVPHVLADILAKQASRIRWLGHPLADTIQKVTQAFVRFSRRRRVPQRAGNDFPFGYFMVAQKPESKVE
jgi:SAM-dependent methyltransferase